MTKIVVLLLLIIMSMHQCANPNPRIVAARSEIKKLSTMEPLLPDDDYVMFWRPQKVGSSTLLSLFISHGYRFNKFPRNKIARNSFCLKIARCALQLIRPIDNAAPIKKLIADTIKSNKGKMLEIAQLRENLTERIPYRFSVNHELCNLESEIVQRSLPCAFKSRSNIVEPAQSIRANVKEIFVVRNPLDRMISIYYFWGELFKIALGRTRGFQPRKIIPHKIRRNLKNSPKNAFEVLMSSQARTPRLGDQLAHSQGNNNKVINGALFRYHGNESSVPPLEIGMEFANRFPLVAGMPGPSFTWSGFAHSARDAVNVMRTDRMMTIVTERLDESLVVAAHFLNWTVADVVVTMTRKALSGHPKPVMWPQPVIDKLKAKLESAGEYAVYQAGMDKLDSRIAQLGTQGVDVQREVLLLKSMRERVSTLCLKEEYLALYRNHLRKEGYGQHFSDNKLRDTDSKFADEGHAFSLNGELLYSYDLCGGCEAAAMQLALDTHTVTDNNFSNLPSLKDLKFSQVVGHVQLAKCPVYDLK